MNIQYRICYDKHFNRQIPEQIIEAGWEYLLANTRFYVLRTSRENPFVIPSYTSILERNRKIKFVVGIILLIFICSQLPMLLIIGVVLIMVLTGNTTVEIIDSSEVAPVHVIQVILGTLIPLTFIILFVWLVYTFFMLQASNKRIEESCHIMPALSFTIPTAGLMSKRDERVLLKSKKMIRKRKWAWFYAPDKAEHWLEEMESNGYNLYRMSKPGNCFYFIKGTPRRMKYAVDYQNKTGPSYFNINTECGWKLIFTSATRFQAITVWSYEYTNDGDTQEFYSDEQSKLKHAKRFALTYSLCFFPLCALYIALIILEIFVRSGYTDFWFSLSIQTLLVIEFGRFAFRTIFYYFRIKKKLRDK